MPNARVVELNYEEVFRKESHLGKVDAPEGMYPRSIISLRASFANNPPNNSRLFQWIGIVVNELRKVDSRIPHLKLLRSRKKL